MRGPQPVPIVLSDAERQALEELSRRHSTPQQRALRARIVLAAADGLNHRQIARRLDISLDTARRWRQRWRALQAVAGADLSVAERLEDAPRAGRPVRISAAQGREIAAEIMQRGIVACISERHATRLLKRGRCSRTAGATG